MLNGCAVYAESLVLVLNWLLALTQRALTALQKSFGHLKCALTVDRISTLTFAHFADNIGARLSLHLAAQIVFASLALGVFFCRSQDATLAAA